jgi:hypothetical protein
VEALGFLVPNPASFRYHIAGHSGPMLEKGACGLSGMAGRDQQTHPDPPRALSWYAVSTK